ncbi:MAG: sulfatase-like hydrolase/transferase [Acidimicrobiales bacterium]|nr:sulfatase-like hydrolase/transferase [Acidimicrobiales bacterium]
MFRRLFALAGLTALVVVQPLLELFGDNPASVFQVNNIDGWTILWFAVALAVVPPTALWLVGEAARLVREDIGDGVHLGCIGLLATGFGILIAKEVSGVAAVNLLIGLAVGIGVATAYHRYDGVRTWVQLIAVVNLLFLYQFGFASTTADWIETSTAEAVALTPERLDQQPSTGGDDEPPEVAPSVVVIVFDEFPTQSLVTADEQIDAVRFPNFSAFADEATWYRRYSTSSPFSRSAIPSLLDGREPYGDSTWGDHPGNLFSLLAGSHHLLVSEALTQMCGFEPCRSLTPPPAPDPGPSDEDDPDSPEVAIPTVDPAAEDRRWGDLLDTTWNTWTTRVSPARGDDPIGYDDFEEELTPISTTTTTTTLAEDPDSTTVLEHTDDGLTDEERQLERFFDTTLLGQPGRHQDFVDALQPTDEPFLGYLHLVLPHQPWTIRENGVAYEVAAGRTDYGADAEDPWPTLVSWQRHMLQAEYADRLLGVILARLEEIDEYDDTLIVVVSDHGAAFLPGQPSRSLTDTNLPGIVYAPLLIKPPGQTAGAIEDQNVNATDLVPTIADILALGLPWDADGAPAGSPEIDARGARKWIYDYTDAFDFTFLGIREYDGDESWERLLATRFPAVTENEDRLAGLYRNVPGADLIGTDPDDAFGAADGSAAIADLGRLREPGGAPLLGEVAGVIPGTADDATVLVAVNDRIVGVSPLYRRAGTNDSFVVLLPGDALAAADNEIRIAVRNADGTVTERSLS